MRRHLFDVEETFFIRRRGLVLCPGATTEAADQLPRELPIILRRPDGWELRLIARLERALLTNGGCTWPVCLPPGIAKEDVPTGTEVFSVLEGRTISIEQYRQLIEDGYCDTGCDRFFELIRGRIRTSLDSPPLYEHVVSRMLEWGVAASEVGGCGVRCRSAVALDALASMPLIDVMLFAPGDYSRRFPRGDELLLAIDVDDGRTRYAMQERLALFAEAGIPEYWRVRARMKRLEVHRDPIDSTYSSVLVSPPGGCVGPLRLPQVQFLLNAILPDPIGD